MELALADAGLAPARVGYVNAHGTATREGDPIEISAIRAVFGEGAEALPVSATKSGFISLTIATHLRMSLAGMKGPM